MHIYLMKCAICGVGNRMRGDDAAGPMVVERLLEKHAQDARIGEMIFLDCGTAPENFVSSIDKFKPDVVVIIDAVNLGKEPGHVEILDIARIVGVLHSTHQLPLSLFIEYLQKNGGCRVYFVGVQPKECAFGAEMSRECEAAIGRAMDVVSGLIEMK